MYIHTNPYPLVRGISCVSQVDNIVHTCYYMIVVMYMNSTCFKILVFRIAYRYTSSWQSCRLKVVHVYVCSSTLIIHITRAVCVLIMNEYITRGSLCQTANYFAAFANT